MNLTETIGSEEFDPKEFIMGMPQWEFTFFLYYPEYYDERGMMLLRRTAAKKYTRVITAASKAQAKKQFYDFIKTVPPYLAYDGLGVGVVEKPHSDTMRIENIRQLKESVYARDFVLGAWPEVIKALLERGFQQDSRNYHYYQKNLHSGLKLCIDMGANLRHNEKLYLFVLNGYRGFWGATVPYSNIANALDTATAILDPLPPKALDSMDVATETYRKLSALGNHTSVFEADTVVNPRQFVLSHGPFFEFKQKLEELGWKYDGHSPIPTSDANMVDVNEFTVAHEFSEFTETAITVDYTLEVVEVTEEGQQKLVANAQGVKLVPVEHPDSDMRSFEPVTFDVSEQISPVGMTGSDFAEIVDAVVRGESGPDEANCGQPY